MGREGCALTHTIAAVRGGVPSTPLHVCTEGRKEKEEKEVSVLNFPQAFQ